MAELVINAMTPSTVQELLVDVMSSTGVTVSGAVLCAAFIVGVCLGTFSTRLRLLWQSARGVETPEQRRRWERFLRQLGDSRVLSEESVLAHVREAQLPVLGHYGASMGCTSSTVLHEIARCPHASTQLLTRVVEEALRQNPGKTPQEVVNWPNGKGATPLHECCFAGNFENIVWLVQHGANVEAKTHAGRTVLHEVLSSSRSADTVDIMRYLLGKGAPLTACDRMALPVLGSAIYRAPDEVMAVLVSHADPEDLKLQTSSGESLLHLAISEGRKSLVKLLVAAGADVNAVDKRGISVIEAACCAAQPDMAAFLLWKGAKLDAGSSTLFRRCVARGRKYVRIGWTDMPVAADVVTQRNLVFALMAMLGVPVSLNCLVFEKSLMSYPCSTLFLVLSLGAFGPNEEEKFAKHFSSLEAAAATEIAGMTFTREQVGDMWHMVESGAWHEAATSSDDIETCCAWLLLRMIRTHRPRNVPSGRPASLTTVATTGATTTAANASATAGAASVTAATSTTQPTAPTAPGPSTVRVPSLQHLCRTVYRRRVLHQLALQRPQDETMDDSVDRASPRTIRRAIRSHMGSRSASPQRTHADLVSRPVRVASTLTEGTAAAGAATRPTPVRMQPTAAASLLVRRRRHRRHHSYSHAVDRHPVDSDDDTRGYAGGRGAAFAGISRTAYNSRTSNSGSRSPRSARASPTSPSSPSMCSAGAGRGSRAALSGVGILDDAVIGGWKRLRRCGLSWHRGWFSAGSSPTLLHSSDDEDDDLHNGSNDSDGDGDEEDFARVPTPPLSPGLEQQLLAWDGSPRQLQAGNLYTEVKRLPEAFQELLLFDDVGAVWPRLVERCMEKLVQQRQLASAHGHV